MQGSFGLRLEIGWSFVKKMHIVSAMSTIFPMYERDPETKEIGFTHNPFSMPQGGLEALETKDPLDVLAYQYDIVCNGVELSSGAVRNHDMDIMVKAFEIAGYDEKTLKRKFGALYQAFQFGARPTRAWLRESTGC